LEKKGKNTKNANILDTAVNIAKSSKFQPKTILLAVQIMIIGFKLYQKKYFFNRIGRYF